MEKNSRFSAFLAHNGIRPSDVASALGVSRQFVSQLSSGRCRVTPEHIERLRACGYDVQAFARTDDLVQLLMQQLAEKDAQIEKLLEILHAKM